MEGYKDLPFFGQSAIICDFTVEFLKRYISPYSRTTDQMTQAARSGKQNIAEGYQQKDIEGKLRLLKVARGSLEELLEDYKDYLRQHQLTLWNASDSKSQAIRSIGYKKYKDYNDYKCYMAAPEGAANSMVCLINQTNALLDNKIRWLDNQLTTEGGTRFKARLTRDEYLKNQEMTQRKKEDAWLAAVIEASKQGKPIPEFKG